VLSPEEVDSIRAYVIKRAHEDKALIDAARRTQRKG
jgi:hypothetical protein